MPLSTLFLCIPTGPTPSVSLILNKHAALVHFHCSGTFQQTCRHTQTDIQTNRHAHYNTLHSSSMQSKMGGQWLLTAFHVTFMCLCQIMHLKDMKWKTMIWQSTGCLLPTAPPTTPEQSQVAYHGSVLLRLTSYIADCRCRVTWMGTTCPESLCSCPPPP